MGYQALGEMNDQAFLDFFYKSILETRHMEFGQNELVAEDMSTD